MKNEQQRHDISDAVWSLLEPHLPGQRGQDVYKRQEQCHTGKDQNADHNNIAILEQAFKNVMRKSKFFPVSYTHLIAFAAGSERQSDLSFIWAGFGRERLNAVASKA